MKTRKIIFPIFILLSFTAATAFGNNCCPPTGAGSNGPEPPARIQPIQTLMPASVASLGGAPDAIILASDFNNGYLHPAEMIIGRVAGVWVTGSYNYYQIRIRGAVGPPLLVIDNMPFYNYDDAALNPLLWTIPPADIDRIEVIKNIAGAAIYGSQAGNGVIRIVTRRGWDETTEGEE